MTARGTRGTTRAWGRTARTATGAVTAVAAAAAVSVGTAGAAQAAIVVDVVETFAVTPPDLACTAPDGTAFTLSRSVSGEQTFRLKTKAAGSIETFLELRYVDRLTWTNTTTGISFTGVREGQDKDSALVERLEGGQYAVLTAAQSRTTFYAPDGTRAGVQVGVERYRTVLDSKGTADPTDDEFVDGVLLVGAGNPGKGVCDFAAELTLG
ncbi:hypothetical protein G7072_18655 [Nocardioides sp. HDW12B]|uniref:hypothetical protein n=1 Tax=Nocardioides sp. HDW12B TaxID=2714939 RepID=UPI00140C1961|nr:hypothetical protein [Nocardioides sp. HDW12B]QIK68092.1 hypothetical protein G7072_18655 [Nocardioides sp. HDW12B]